MIKTEPNVSSPFDSIAVGRIEDSCRSSKSRRESETYFDQFAATERMHDPRRARSEAWRPSNLDEVDLLELPPLENGKTIEFTTTENITAIRQGKQVMSLSPELMDIIVQKVVEKLSEK